MEGTHLRAQESDSSTIVFRVADLANRDPLDFARLSNVCDLTLEDHYLGQISSYVEQILSVNRQKLSSAVGNSEVWCKHRYAEQPSVVTHYKSQLWYTVHSPRNFAQADLIHTLHERLVYLGQRVYCAVESVPANYQKIETFLDVRSKLGIYADENGSTALSFDLAVLGLSSGPIEQRTRKVELSS